MGGSRFWGIRLGSKNFGRSARVALLAATSTSLAGCHASSGARPFTTPEVKLNAPRSESGQGASSPRESDKTASAQAAEEFQVETLEHCENDCVEPPRDPGILWCVSGGAPVVGLPVIDEKNRAYVATSDGYLHAFERDGRYRWSYTVKGTPLGSVSLRASDGLILMGTTSQLVYAITQQGTLYWSFNTVTPVWSGLFALNAGSVVFVGLDQRLYALSNSGGALYRVRAPQTPMGGPVVAPHDVVWVPLSDGVARFHAAYRLEHFRLPSAVEQLVTFREKAAALAAEKAYLIESQAEPQDLGAADYLASDSKHLLLATETALTLVEVGGKRRELKVDLGELGAAPALADGRAWVPGADGILRIVELDQGVIDEIRVGTVALKTPVVSSTGDYVILTDAMGRFCAFDPAVSRKFDKH